MLFRKKNAARASETKKIEGSLGKKNRGISPSEVREVSILDIISDPSALDEAHYLSANPDVAAAGIAAGDHWLRHGRSENRKQYQVTAIAELRAEKLRRVRFADKTSLEGTENFISEEAAREFEIPAEPPIAQNEYSPEIIQYIREHPEHLILDVGAGLRHTCYSNVVTAEIWPSLSTDVVCLAEDMPFADEQFDHVMCLAVLEHTRRPWVAVEEILRVLKPGGTVRIDWPFLQPVHGYPHHYFNATKKGVISQFEGRCEIISSEVRPWQHPIFTLTWLLHEWLPGLPKEEQDAFAQLTIGEIAGTSPEILLRRPFCDHLAMAQQEVICAGTTLIARKH